MGEDELWTLEIILGYVFTPITYIMGVPWEECQIVGRLIGVKMMVNEFVAFAQFAELRDQLSVRISKILFKIFIKYYLFRQELRL